MSISSEISRINGNIAEAYAQVSVKGGTLPGTQNSANLPEAIESIPSGGTYAALTAIANGNYTPPSGYDAFDAVTVAIPIYNGTVE